MKINNQVFKKWDNFLNNEKNHGHATREVIGGTISNHIDLCYASAMCTANRISLDVADSDVLPVNILEIGSSTGLNCFALSKVFPNAKVFGVEPERLAVNVANSMKDEDCKNIDFLIGVGEKLPFEDGLFDLIVCHTVIEHVNDPSKVISEMNRVLKHSGNIHLEAPNYFWPYEPHLQIICIPLFGKWLVKLLAVLQGKGKLCGFIDHLKFVHPRYLEAEFKLNGLNYHNRVAKKIDDIFNSKGGTVLKYYKISKFLYILKHFGLARLVKFIILKSHLYPSVLYTLSRSE